LISFGKLNPRLFLRSSSAFLLRLQHVNRNTQKATADIVSVPSDGMYNIDGVIDGVRGGARL
jgi:hypothetical protein